MFTLPVLLLVAVMVPNVEVELTLEMELAKLV
jgi:hypothetical protein